ncbi:YciI family protein [Micromonospora sp. NPDC047620]|uniref:YciI family protein n=1 Tax=Micromonospora sp. NPDC047620 TaxID=3364251 RepID=UPI003714911F
MRFVLLSRFSVVTTDAAGAVAWRPEDLETHFRYMRDLNRTLGSTGELVSTHELALAQQARVVRAGGGDVVVDDAGRADGDAVTCYWLVDCETLERAVEIAASVSAAPGPSGLPLNHVVELRRVIL